MSGLLLTGTIDSGVFNNTNVVVTDTKDRLNQYVNTIIRYIKESNFDKVVFVENSGYEFPTKHIMSIAEKYKKQFEYIYVKTDIEKTIRLGKSYGEAVLMEYGIKYSELLKEEEFIYKCTGRVFVKNINSLIHKEKNTNQFLAYNNIRYCFTLFYKISRKDFLEFYTDMGEECDEKNGRSIEYVMYERTVNNHVKCDRFVLYPDFCGVCGTDGQRYDCSRLRMFVKNILLVIGEYSVDAKRGKMMDVIFRILKMGPKYECNRKR